MNRKQFINKENKGNKIYSKIKKNIRNQSAITQKNTNYLDFIAKKSINDYQKLYAPKNKNKRNIYLNITKKTKNKSNKISEKITSKKSLSIKTIKNAQYNNFKKNQMKLYFITRKIIIKHYFSNFINLLTSLKKNNYNNSSPVKRSKNDINLETIKLNTNFDAKIMIDNISEQLSSRNTKSIRTIYTPHSQESINNSFNKIISNKTYCFPDNKFHIIRGLDKRDKLLRSEDNFRPILKNIAFDYYDLFQYILKNKKTKKPKNKIYNYNTFSSKESEYDKEVINMVNKMNLPSDRYPQNDVILEKSEEFRQSIINKEWINLPMLLIKFTFTQNLKKYGKNFLEKLKKINAIKLKEMQKEKLIYCFKLINKKILKYYFRIYRDNIIVARVENIIFKNNFNNNIDKNENCNNVKLKNTKKKAIKRNKKQLEKRAEIFITKNTKLSIYNKKFLIFTNKIGKIFDDFIMKKFIYLLKLYNNKSLSAHNLNNISAEKYQKPKKYIRVKYLSKSIHSLSKKTSASESKGSGELSVSPYIRKMKIEQRNIPMITNFKKLEDDENDDGDDNMYYLNKIKNIIINAEKKRKLKYFKAWKKTREEEE